MPKEVFIDLFLISSTSLKNYTRCYYDARTTPQAKKEGPVFDHQCLEESGLEEYCGYYKNPKGNPKPANVANAMENECSDYLDIARKLVASGKDKDAVQNVKGDKQKEKLEVFLKYERCKQILYKYVDPCLEKSDLIRKCQTSRIRTTKILRLKMPFIEHFLQAFPDMQVIYYTRDPRAMVASRYGKDGPKIPESWKRGVLLLCDEMASDIQALDELEPKYPGVFLRVRYEDLVSNPDETMVSLFDHIDLDPLPETYEWLNESLHSTKNEGVRRTNATLVMSRWRTRFQESDIDEVSHNPRCWKVLKRLGYE